MFDEVCSGYAFGNAAILAALRANDGNGEATLILDLVNERLGMLVLEALDEIYKKGKRYIASFADIVFEANRMGDKIAMEIIDKNVDHLAKLIRFAYKRYRVKKRVGDP